jgi:hypothetical protein
MISCQGLHSQALAADAGQSQVCAPQAAGGWLQQQQLLFTQPNGRKNTKPVKQYAALDVGKVTIAVRAQQWPVTVQPG